MSEVRFIILIYPQDYYGFMQTKNPYALVKLSCLTEADLQQSSIYMAGVYLMLLIQFLENKVAIELTRTEFAEAQEVCFFMLCLYIWVSVVYCVSTKDEQCY